ncbi:10057_t:CDS:1 [Ambispora leptoticha]|uniref:10057_t:CDS:1 n=1 Tax=Ambispora leptoticha TaxID=144679 RepID=A0A9N9FUA5_9GLOM|nr:10057_t:CDS:1 [Ambispora leptoticha]
MKDPHATQSIITATLATTTIISSTQTPDLDSDSTLTIPKEFNDPNTLRLLQWVVLLACIFGGAFFYLLATFIHLCVHTYYSRTRLFMITTIACGFGTLRLFLSLYDFATFFAQTTPKTILFICLNILAFGLSDLVLYLRAAPFSKYPLITLIIWALTSITKIVLFSLIDEPRFMYQYNQKYILLIQHRLIIFNVVYDVITIVYYAYISWVFIEHLRERGLLTTGHVYGPTNDHAVKFRRLVHVSITYGLLGMGVVALTRFLRVILSSNGDVSCLMLGLAVAAEVCIVPCMIKAEIESKRSVIRLLSDGGAYGSGGGGNVEKHMSDGADSIMKWRSSVLDNNRHVNIDNTDNGSSPSIIVAGVDDDIRNTMDNRPRNLIISLGSSIIDLEDHNGSRNQSQLLSPYTCSISSTPIVDSPPGTHKTLDTTNTNTR